METEKLTYNRELSMNGFYLPVINESEKMMIVGGYAISYKTGDYGRFDGRHLDKLGNGIKEFIGLLKNNEVVTYYP